MVVLGTFLFCERRHRKGKKKFFFGVLFTLSGSCLKQVSFSMKRTVFLSNS